VDNANQGKHIDKKSTFTFDCHPGVSCFTDCCKDVDMTLYPYDIIRLRKRLNISSEQFLNQHTEMEFDDNFWFPRLVLKMSDNEDFSCPFLSASGCTVYDDRPFSCRSYPLARSVKRSCSKERQSEKYYLVCHDHCKGHQESKTWKISEWIEQNNLHDYNEMNASWISVDTLLKSYPFDQKGMNMTLFRLLITASYNLDNFRLLLNDEGLSKKFDIPHELKTKAKTCDITLMELGFAFIRHCLTGEPISYNNNDLFFK